MSHQLQEIISNLPESPGIYKFFDKKNRLLYIGKSKNLKQRIQTYFRKQSDETKERTLILINNINNINIEQTETELEALILEDKLIKQHLPPYNVKQKKFRSQVYLAVTDDEFPAIKIIDNDEVDFTCKMFGPFKDKFSAEYILYALQKILKLRKCNDPVPHKKCILAGIDKCMGPCIGKIDVEQYKQKIEIAVDFLNGNFNAISTIIDDLIANSAAELNFEAAAEWRDLKNFCLNFCKRQQFMQDFMQKNIAILKGKFSFIFQQGELKKVYQKKVSADYFKKHLDNKFRKENPTCLMDRSFVVWVWLKQNNAEYQVIA